MISEKELHEIIEIALDNTTTNSCDNVEGTTKSIMLLDYSKEQLTYIYNEMIETGLFISVGNERFALSKDGAYLNSRQASYRQFLKENYKEQLEIEKAEREIEKLKYEKANQELDNEIKGLTKQNLELSNKNAILTKINLKLQNWDIKFRWIIAVSTFAAGFLLRVCWLALSRLWQ